MATPTAAAELAVSRDRASEGTTYRFALVVLTSLFFMWGFLTCLNDIMIPHLKASFSLNYTQAMLVQFVFFAAYFVVSMPAGSLIRRVGYRHGIVIGLVVAGLGCLLFFPAASMRSYGLFLGGFFVLASGITVLQVAANPYVAILGRPETASSRLNLTQAFNSLGTTVAPFFGSMLILSTVLGASELSALSATEVETYQAAQAAAVQWPYVGLASVLFVIALVFMTIKLPAIEAGDEGVSEGARENAGGVEGSAAARRARTRTSAWQHRHLVLGAVAIFVYVGGEVAIGSFLVNYLGQPEIAGFSEAVAGQYVTYYWGGAMIGRFAGAAIMRYVSPGKLLGFNGLVAAGLVVTTMVTTGPVAMWSILAVGLFNSIMFPTIFTLAVRGLGRHTSQGSGILCAAIVGGALIPLLQGVLADAVGIQLAFVLPVACYAYIVFYGLRGSDASDTPATVDGVSDSRQPLS
ncbi:MAG: sugar MFS transporter [Deltaproteobacteria bacterium]|nr:sugar MFS transporter [Deltaproteobacteria bacterium]